GVEMPRACPVVPYVRVYTRRGRRARMPRACPVVAHVRVSSKGARQRMLRACPVVAHARVYLPAPAPFLGCHGLVPWSLTFLARARGAAERTPCKQAWGTTGQAL